MIRLFPTCRVESRQRRGESEGDDDDDDSVLVLSHAVGRGVRNEDHCSQS